MILAACVVTLPFIQENDRLKYVRARMTAAEAAFLQEMPENRSRLSGYRL